MRVMPSIAGNKETGGQARVHRPLDDWFSGFFSDLDHPGWSSGYWPAVDIIEKDDTFVVVAEVPDVRHQDVDISITGNILTIMGEKHAPLAPPERGYLHSERLFGVFRRDINVNADINTRMIEARCENGLLTVTLPKSKKDRSL